MTPNLILLYSTYPNHIAAATMAKQLLEKKLIGCASMYAATSIFRWEGAINEEQEVVLLVKTVERFEQRVRKEIEATHPYQVPCILTIPISAHGRYLERIQQETESEDPGE